MGIVCLDVISYLCFCGRSSTTPGVISTDKMGNSNSQDVESTAAETQNEKTAYVDLQEVSRGEGSPIPEAIPEVDEECSEDEGELSEDKRFETVMRVVIHSINDIERSTDI